MSAVTLAGLRLELDPSGAVFAPEAGVLVVADLHFEKGSSFAARGVLLPPYDSLVTLDGLEGAIGRHGPRRVVALGDSFHDAGGPARLDPLVRQRLGRLAATADLVWVAGNHDPALPASLPGRVAECLELGPVALIHDPSACRGPWIAGHFHPKARVTVRGRAITARCFVADGERLLLPAFGAYAGGLEVRDPAIRRLFPGAFDTHVIGPGAIHRLAGRPRRAALPAE